MEIGWNELNESVSVSFGQFFELIVLYVSWNHLIGVLSEEHFAKLSKLKMLCMSGNSGLVLNVSATWVLPFQISTLDMDLCNLSPSFSTWLKFQKEVSILELSNASILGSITNWFQNIFSQLGILVISFNQLQGQLPNQLNMTSLTIIDLSNNIFSGPIPPNIGESIPNFLYSLLSNQITGIIPKSIGYMSHLEILDLSRNSLIGSIPSFISNYSYLYFLTLEKNNLSKTIPKSFGQLEWL